MIRASILSVLMLQLVSGCAYLRIASGLGYIEPEVRLSNISVEQFELQEIRLTVGLELTNPNNFAMSTERLSYALQLAGLDIAQGDLEDKLSLPANGATTVALPIRIKTDSAMRLLSYVVQHGRKDVPARIEGKLYLPGLLNALPVTFARERNVSL